MIDGVKSVGKRLNERRRGGSKNGGRSAERERGGVVTVWREAVTDGD